MTGTVPLRLGIVGLGMAGGVMVQAALSHPDFRIAGAADPDPRLRERFAADFQASVHADIGPLLDQDDVDAVYIATPHQMHRDHVLAAAKAGKHVIVEKPMALSPEDCDLMIGACEAAGVVLVVGHTHGFDPALATARQLMQQEMGPAALITSLNYTDFLYRPRRPEELCTDLGGGVLFNQLPHQVDMVRTLIDAPVTHVRAIACVLDPARNTEGLYSVLLEFANGAAATLTYSGYDGFDSDEFYDWVGEGGFAKRPAQGSSRRALTTTDEAAARRDRYGYGSGLSAGFPAHQPHFGLTLITCPGGDIRLTPQGVTLYGRDGVRQVPTQFQPWRPGRGDVLNELLTAVRDGEAPRHDGRFGRDTVRVCLAVLQSARERREIRLEPRT